MKGLLGATLGLVFGASLVGCAPRPRMCTASPECADKHACVAGRCQLEKPTVKPAVDSARRLVVRPVDLAVVSRGEGPTEGGLPPLFALGRGSTKLLLRFAVSLPATANVVEAYVVLRRSSLVDDDPAPVHLHATRIEEPWMGGSVSWALQPRTGDKRSPTTTAEPAGAPLVRVDVRDLVRHWAKRDPKDQGVAIEAENETRSGTTFALAAQGADHDAEPYLELYVR